MGLGLTYAAMRRFEEGEQIAKGLLESSNKPQEENADYLFLVAMLHVPGDHDTAIRLLEKALAVARRQYHRAYMGALAETYALMGDQDNALAWYRKTLESDTRPLT